MKTYFLVLLAAGGGITSAQASSTATTRIVAHVPPSCSIDVLNRAIEGHRITMTLWRRCNTSHEVYFSADQAVFEAGNDSLHFNDLYVPMTSGFGQISQSEGYYDTIDRIVIEQQKGSDKALVRAADSVNVTIEAS